MKLIKQKINEKTIPPNIDMIKLIYSQLQNTQEDYTKFTDEMLEKEKQKLLKQLEGEDDDSRKD